MGTASAVLAQLTRSGRDGRRAGHGRGALQARRAGRAGTSTTALLLLVDDTGRVVRRNVEIEMPVTDDDVGRVRTVLAEQVIGRRMADIHETIDGLVDEAPAELRPVMQAVRSATEADLAVDLVRRVFVGGPGRAGR